MTTSTGSILIVEGDQSANMMLSSKLSREGYYNVAVAPAQYALAGVRDYDVVILDDKMPGTPLAELLLALVKRSPDTQVIVAVATIDREKIEESIRLGASDYVTKPYNNSDVVERVEAAMTRKMQIANNNR